MKRLLLTRTARYSVALVATTLILGGPVQPAAAAPATPDAPVLKPLVAAPGTAAALRRRTPPPLPEASQERLRRQDALLPTARELVRQARAATSDIGAVRVDATEGKVHVYRTDPRRPLRLPAGTATDQVVVHQARFNRAATVRAVEKLTRDDDSLAGRNVAVNAVAANADGSGLTVAVTVDAATAEADVRRATTELRSRYGDIIAAVRAVPGTAADQKLYFYGPRFNDSVPWSGGDRIQINGGGCTTGISALLGSAPVMLTAAHCGGTGSQVYNGPNYDGGFSYMGQVVQSNGATDTGVISVQDAWPFVNVGPAEDAYQVIIDSWATPVVGEYVCQSGSYSGEVCDLQVVSSGVRICTRRNILRQCRAWAGPFADAIHLGGAGVPAAGFGDSGAPVYQRWAPSAGYGSAVGLVRGTLTPMAASWYPDYYPPRLECSAPEGWSVRCSSGFSFSHMPGY